MKIAFINTSDRRGGAAVACMRLAESLRKEGEEVIVLVNEKLSDNEWVKEVNTGFVASLKKKLYFYTERLEIFVKNGFKRKNLFSVSTSKYGFDLSDNKYVKDADIIHIHWSNMGMLSLKGIRNLIDAGKPIVITMHDMWYVTGICHNPDNCDRYVFDCGKCPFINSESKHDLSSSVLKKKKSIIMGAGIHFVSCSKWLGEMASKSILAPGNSFNVIANPIDIDFFSPGDKNESRIKLGLPIDKKLVLFGAAIASDKRKGIDYLQQASLLLAGRSDEYELLMVGQIKGETEIPFGLKVHRFGYVDDMEKMRMLYRAADLFVTPSIAENLPNMIMEAMACATPCVGFNIGGIPEMIEHKKTGYIARFKQSDDLAAGIDYTADNSEKLGNLARAFVVEHYSQKNIARLYSKLYSFAIYEAQTSKG